VDRSDLGGVDGPAYIELTSSRDLRTWKRVCDRAILIPAGEKGTWNGRADLSELAGRPVRLRFALTNAKLYSFVF